MTKNVSGDAAVAEAYLKTLRPLSDNVKLRLAALLTNSVAEERAQGKRPDDLTQRMLEKHFGAWEGDETSEEIMQAIRENSSIRKPVEL